MDVPHFYRAADIWGVFASLFVRNSAAVNIHVPVFEMNVSFFLGKCGIAVSHRNCV